MGNRDALLKGAKACLYERGYAHTTARDIAAAAGTSLAAIGYHYGSTEALMSAAMIAALQDWGEALEQVLAGDLGATSDPLERFERTWTRTIEGFAANRTMLAASVEAAAQSAYVPAVREVIADGLQQGREGLAALFGGVAPEAIDEQTVRTTGSVYQALMTGMVIQWLIDPERAPSGRELAEGLRRIAADVGVGDARPSPG